MGSQEYPTWFHASVAGSWIYSSSPITQLQPVVFGPLGLDDYERLLPGGLSFHRLVPIVRNYAGDALIWDVNLILRADEVPAWLKAWRSDTAEAPTEDPKRTAAAYEALMRGVCGGCGLRTLDADGKCRACGARKAVGA